MKTIKQNGTEPLVGYKELKNYEQFIYTVGQSEFVAIKINDDYCAFLTGMNKFILAQKYKNCLSIGSLTPIEYDTFEAAEKEAIENKPIIF